MSTLTKDSPELRLYLGKGSVSEEIRQKIKVNRGSGKINFSEETDFLCSMPSGELFSGLSCAGEVLIFSGDEDEPGLSSGSQPEERGRQNDISEEYVFVSSRKSEGVVQGGGEQYDSLVEHRAYMEGVSKKLSDSPSSAHVDTLNLLTAVDAAKLAGNSDKTINRWYGQMKIVGLRVGVGLTGQVLYPSWQFQQGKVIPGLSEILTLLGDNSAKAYRFLTLPSPRFEGRKPVELLLDGRSNEILLVLGK